MRDLSVYLNADTATVADLRDAVIIFSISIDLLSFVVFTRATLCWRGY